MRRMIRSCYRAIRTLLLAGLGAVWLVAGAAEIRIVTEEMPPYNMTQHGKITGLSTEVLRAVLDEVGMQAPIQPMPWARAYDLALNSENVLIYSIARTPQREKLFKWVGVVAPTNWYLYARADNRLNLSGTDDVRKYQVATVNEDAGEQYLVNKGSSVGKNLQSSSKYELSYEKLKLGRVDLWIANELNAYYVVRQAGDDPSKAIVRVLALPDLSPDGGLSLAFSPQTSDALVERFRKALETIKRNGTFDTIKKRWL